MADEQSVKREWSHKKAPLMTRWAEQVLPRLLLPFLLFLLIRFDIDDGTTRWLRTKPPTPTIPALWWNEKSGRIWTVHFWTFAKADKSQNKHCHSLQRYKKMSKLPLILLCFLSKLYIWHCRDMGDGRPGSNWANPFRIPSEHHGPLLRWICPLWGCIFSHWKKVSENLTT